MTQRGKGEGGWCKACKVGGCWLLQGQIRAQGLVGGVSAVSLSFASLTSLAFLERHITTHAGVGRRLGGGIGELTAEGAPGGPSVADPGAWCTQRLDAVKSLGVTGSSSMQWLSGACSG